MAHKLLIVIAIVVPMLLLHHWYIHGNLRGASRWFQWNDINNHETVILLLIGVAIGIVIAKYL